MAIDNTPPRLRLIMTIATIVVITLVGLDFVFRSYYGFMTEEAKFEKLAPTKEKTDQSAAEQASLTGAQIPLEQAMAQIAKGTRSEFIEPKQSEDIAPMTGWSKMPKQPPLPVPADSHPATTATATAIEDAGAPAMAPPTTKKDAGARAPGH